MPSPGKIIILINLILIQIIQGPIEACSVYKKVTYCNLLLRPVQSSMWKAWHEEGGGVMVVKKGV